MSKLQERFRKRAIRRDTRWSIRQGNTTTKPGRKLNTTAKQWQPGSDLILSSATDNRCPNSRKTPERLNLETRMLKQTKQHGA